ncbi:uncharacterized protein LOC127250846 [Andrographis paniculata]|uniref:uncharacterized protein LOC127250846 n=1 Tax=Andrographis paniculata TaxID=175694 RepID=UPI0021E82C00|nr:uncharacterized protein LOC127250846 [Andrographis paniculata]
MLIFGVIITPLLNGRNYHSWARSMKLVLRSKNKIGFVDGTLTEPVTTSPLHEAWLRCNTMALSWIQHSVRHSIVKSIMWIDHAAQVWKDLYDRFSQGDIFRIAELQKDFYKLSQGLNDQYAQVRSQIMLHDPLPSINKVFSMLILQERQLSALSINDINSDPKAFALNSNQRSHNRMNSSYGGSQERGNSSGGRIKVDIKGQLKETDSALNVNEIIT